MKMKLYSVLRYTKYQLLRYLNFKFKNAYFYDNYMFFEIKSKNKHVFCGYYDINPFSSCNRKVLVNLSSRNFNSNTIAYYDIDDRNIHRLYETNVNSWQMGSRLQWFKNNTVIFNDFFENKFISKIIDLDGNLKRIIDFPIYELSKSRTIALSLDFYLLHLLREGYGYNNYAEELKNYYSKSLNKVNIIDLENNVIKKSIDMQDMLHEFPVDDKSEYYHYFNHLSFNPSNSYFSFFHLWKSKINDKLFNRLIISDLESNIIFVLEEGNRVSHYTWKNDTQLLITTYVNGLCKYVKYTFNFKTFTFIKEDNYELFIDGHPTYINNNIFISDTYPNKYSYQDLFTYDESVNIKTDIARIFSNPMYFGYRRCDLHPKLNLDKNIISIDVHLRNRRSVYIIHMPGKELSNGENE